MKRYLICLLLPIGLWWHSAAHAALNVLACEPEWGALVAELAGDKAAIHVATTPRQDPHRIEARPSLIARARNADLLVCNGAELEIGWLPLLQRESGNPRVQPGQPGWFEAAQYVELIEKPSSLDRSAGDVHAAGNPHFHVDPRNLLPVATALAARLAEIDAANAAHYQHRLTDFRQRWQAAITRWEQRAAPLRGMPVAVQHKNWSYLLRWLGMKAVIDLEPKSGVEPSAAYLAEVVQRLRQTPVRMVLRASYHSPRPAQWVAQHSGIAAVELPFTVGASEQATDLFGVYDDIIERLLEASQ
ncbi:metal ABC transporter substrate-binding protein [Sulfurivermis fontis]|uniref:metal ABC transporter substrate-binding protein n=1 Tax=Sulfurivermis fontis TaxID=1972068 RepID=UPI000FD6E65E|nr:zinc ABC transporter substrate-binding protein [Sulfurivermis fontis]